MSVQVRPVTADRWSDLVSVFGRRGEDPSWCWCRHFFRSAAEESAPSRPQLDNRHALRQEKVLTDDPEVWWVTCFAVDSHYRRAGVGTALLKAAVEFAREHGATAVEGHPVDVAALKAARVGGSAVFTGTMAMFLAAGFTEIARTYPTRPVMRLPL
jgi:GNAT superfamily N-acetyltransferase